MSPIIESSPATLTNESEPWARRQRRSRLATTTTRAPSGTTRTLSSSPWTSRCTPTLWRLPYRPRTRFDRVWHRASERVEQAHVRALEVLQENWGAVEALVEELLERRALDRAAFAGVMTARMSDFDEEG